MKVKRSIIVLALLSFMSIPAIGKVKGKENSKEKTENSEKVSLVPKISGLANIRYSYDDDAASTHGFDVRRVRLSVKGNMHEKVDYCVQAEYAGTVRIIDAYFRWKIMPELNVQVGEFKVESSLESTYGPTSWMLIENPTAVTKLNGYNDLSGVNSHKNGRDIGMRLYGSFIHKENFDVLRYSVGVYNGNGINVKDNNNKKDVAGFLWIKPMRQLSFTGGYYSGSYGPKGATHVRNRASAGVEWKDTKLTVRSEYLWGHTSFERSNGAYLQAGYTVHRMIQPVVSYDFFKRHIDAAGYEHNAQVGINITPIKNLRVQAAYTHTFLNAGGHKNLVEVQAVASF
ncbi:MAG: hypothetical protein J5671_01435 [Bacteroidaceae bacterium]|nr:hypothetical protein [Bacteroidaceae bacterium]